MKKKIAIIGSIVVVVGAIAYLMHRVIKAIKESDFEDDFDFDEDFDDFEDYSDCEFAESM